ncbi:MAG: trypsin-like peptidase domain-containing protein [Thermomicrobiales bacterium]
MPDGRKFDASVLGRAPKQDIAVIKIEGDDLPVATLAQSEDLAIGQWVVAIGNALGLEGGASVTVGVVSALDRSIRPSQNEPAIEGLIQTDAAINPGNSGGPLVNLDGEVVGVNTAKIPQAEGIGFAVPIDTAESIIDQIMSGEPQATLGISAATVTPEIAVRFNLPTDSGVLVIDVDADGAADAASVQVGDVITGLDGETIESVDQLRSQLDSYEPGDSVELTVNRGGEAQNLTVELGESIVIR